MIVFLKFRKLNSFYLLEAEMSVDDAWKFLFCGMSKLASMYHFTSVPAS